MLSTFGKGTGLRYDKRKSEKRKRIFDFSMVDDRQTNLKKKTIRSWPLPQDGAREIDTTDPSSFAGFARKSAGEKLLSQLEAEARGEGVRVQALGSFL